MSLQLDRGVFNGLLRQLAGWVVFHAGEEERDGNIVAIGNLDQIVDREIVVPVFDVAEIRSVDADHLGKLILALTALHAQCAHARSDFRSNEYVSLACRHASNTRRPSQLYCRI